MKLTKQIGIYLIMMGLTLSACSEDSKNTQSNIKSKDSTRKTNTHTFNPDSLDGLRIVANPGHEMVQIDSVPIVAKSIDTIYQRMKYYPALDAIGTLADGQKDDGIIHIDYFEKENIDNRCRYYPQLGDTLISFTNGVAALCKVIELPSHKDSVAINKSIKEFPDDLHDPYTLLATPLTIAQPTTIHSHNEKPIMPKHINKSMPSLVFRFHPSLAYASGSDKAWLENEFKKIGKKAPAHITQLYVIGEETLLAVCYFKYDDHIIPYVMFFNKKRSGVIINFYEC